MRYYIDKSKRELALQRREKICDGIIAIVGILGLSALIVAASIVIFGIIGIAEGSDCLCSQWLTATIKFLIPA